MASPNLWHFGYGATSGADMGTRSPILTSGVVHFVHHSLGNNSYAGTDRSKPVATLAQAVTNASAGDAIQVMESHTETLTGAISFNKAGLRVRGEGSGSTRPRFTCNGAIAMFDVTVAGVWFDNLYFPASSAAPTARIRVAGAAGYIRRCKFDCGANDTGPAVKMITGADTMRIRSTEFESTATSATAQPSIALDVTNAVSDLDMDTVTFTGGSYGWSDYAFKGSAAITRICGVDGVFAGGADWLFATGTTGEFHATSTSGAARGTWTA